VPFNIEAVSESIHKTAKEKGFWDDNNGIIFYLKQLAMVHSEVSETLEAIRKEKGEREVVEELADIIIRVLDLYAGLKEDGYVVSNFEEVFLEKITTNTIRPKMHGVLA
jgi:NTP pyrophosphatase (non-canonical NTP hydrolase)